MRAAKEKFLHVNGQIGDCHGSFTLKVGLSCCLVPKQSHQSVLMGVGSTVLSPRNTNRVAVDHHSLARFCAERGMNPAALTLWCDVRNVTN